TLDDCLNPGFVSHAGELGSVPAVGIVCTGALYSVTADGMPDAELQFSEMGIQAVSPPFDFDNDGGTEYFLASTANSPIIWQPGISLPESYDQLQAGIANRVHAADHTGDGRLDLVFSTSDTPGNWYGSSTSFNVSPLYVSEPDDVAASSGIAF